MFLTVLARADLAVFSTGWFVPYLNNPTSWRWAKGFPRVDFICESSTKGVAFVANHAHILRHFPAVGGLVSPKSISLAIASCWWNLLTEWMALSPWKLAHLCHANGGNRLCPQLSFSEFHHLFQTMSMSKQHQVLIQESDSVTFIQDAITVPWFTVAVSVLFGSSPRAGYMPNWNS